MFDGRRAISGLMAALVLGAMGFGIAIAQDEDSAEAGMSNDAEVPVQQSAQVSAEEQLTEAERTQERATSISRQVMGMLDEARRERDIIRVTCLNDKLTQINAHLRTFTSRRESLIEANNVGDESRRNHEYTVITVLAQQFQTLEQEAGQCMGQDIFETGTTRVVTDIDPATPEDDPSVIIDPTGPSIPFIPPAASSSGM